MSSSDTNKASHGFGVSQTAPNANSGLTHCTIETEHDAMSNLSGSNLQEVRQINITKNYEYDFRGSKDIDKSTLNPQTPMGHVVEAGHEQTGRWTREEHSAFLAALKRHGKEWKKVAAKVKTRTVVQTRTHAQKYFQKLQKGIGGEKIDMMGLEMSTVAEVKKSTPASIKKKTLMHLKSPNVLTSTIPVPSRQVPIATQAAAHLMAQLSQVKTHNEHSMTAKAPAYPDKYANPEISSSDPYRRCKQGSHILEDYPQTRHQGPISGPSVPTYGTRPAMTIVAPKPEHTMMNGLFPEPSPAACGKRKNLEMDAAHMLAGVAASAYKVRRPEVVTSVKSSPYLHTRGEGGTSFDDANLGFIKPKMNSTPAGVEKSGFGNLKILNPEAFGVMSVNSRTIANRFGQASPHTPWDGQLESLASEVKGKGANGSEEVNMFNDELNTNNVDQESNGYNHPLGNQMKRTALHDAVCRGALQEVKRILENPQSIGQGVDEQRRSQVGVVDSGGFSPLHSAVSLTIDDDAGNGAVTMTYLLLSADANVECLDRCGNTPLHWAARVGNSEVAQILILKSCALDLQNFMGETALHWAMRAGTIGMKTVRVLLENGARSSLFSLEYKRALDVGVDGFASVDQDIVATKRPASTVEGENVSSLSSKESGYAKKEPSDVSVEEITEKRQTRANLLCYSPQARTLVLHHPECEEHVPKSETDWEAPGRISSVMNAVLQNIHSPEMSVRDYEIQVSTDFERASLELLSRVHSAEYLTFVNDLSKELDRRRKARLIEASQKSMDEGAVSKMFHDASVVPFTPMVQRTMGMMRESTVKKGAHSDTSFSSGSLRAARRAAGAVQHAVDRVLIGRNRNAFCVVRPPGHHAGVNGLLAGGESCGFCIFNNVAAGAMHALSDENHRPKCERCAIVDIDAHHGNGTEEIVRKCHDPGRLFFFSVHLYDNDKRKGKSNAYKFYPGTGDEDDVAHNIINVPIMPLWREKDVQQSGKPLVEKRHNTRNSKQKAAAAAAASLPSDKPVVIKCDQGVDPDISKVDGDSVASNGTANLRPTSPTLPSSTSTGREAYRCAIQQRLLPALRAFNPDLILVSLGFDASRGDVGNARHYDGGKEAEGIDLEPEDYAWTTRKIMEVADICCQGRVISILEGGYGRTPTQATKSDDSRESKESNGYLDKTVFSQCAVRHLQALIDPYDAEMRSVVTDDSALQKKLKF